MGSSFDEAAESEANRQKSRRGPRATSLRIGRVRPRSSSRPAPPATSPHLPPSRRRTRRGRRVSSPNAPRTARGDRSRALVDAEAGAVITYSAERSAETRIVGVTAAKTQPVLREIQRLKAPPEARFEATDARFDDVSGQPAQGIREGAERDRTLVALMAQMRRWSGRDHADRRVRIPLPQVTGAAP